MRAASRARRGRPTPLLLVALLALPAGVQAWGFEAHRLVNERATQTLPEPLRDLFEGNAAYLRQHSVDPDVWRTWREGEDPNHFLDLDAFPDLKTGTVPRSEQEHLKRHGDEAAGRGRVPWRVGEVYDELVAAFRKRNVETVLERAAVLGHYVADAHVPLHAIRNYDGGLSGQDGVHGRWETGLFARYQRQIEPAVKPGTAAPVGDPVMFAFGVLQASLERAEGALESDRAAAGDRDYLETAGDDRYDEGYYSRLFELEGERMAGRLGDAAEATGSLWLSAWQKAGRPTLDWSFRFSHVRGESRLVVAVLEGAGADLVDTAADRGALPHLDALRREGSVGRLRPPFPARAAATQATLWTGAWPRIHGVVGDGASRPAGTVLETTHRSPALGAEPLWVTAPREGVETVVVNVPQAAPFAPFLENRRFGGDFGRYLILLTPEDGDIEPAVLTAPDLALRPARAWTGETAPSSLEVEVPVGSGTLPGLLYDDPDDPASGLDTLALSGTRDLADAVRLKPSPAGREEDGFASVRFQTGGGLTFVHFRLFTLTADGRDILLWHSAGARTLGSRERVAAAAMEQGGLLAGGTPDLYRGGSLGPPLWEGGDGTAERRYLETVRLAVRQHARLASLTLERTRWGLAVLSLPFPEEFVRLWGGRLDPSLPGHDAAVAVRLRPFLDEALRLADSWVGEIARRTPSDAALAIVGDRGLGASARVARPNVALRAAGLLVTREDGTIDLGQTKAVYAPANGGFLVVNLDTRPDGIQPLKGAALVRAASIGAMREMRDPASGEPVMAELLMAGDRGAPPGIGGPSGGFLYLRPVPGVVLSAETSGPPVETVEARGEAFDPALPSAAGLLVLTGRGVAGGRRLGDVAAVDVAPTLATLLGLPPPAQAAGEPLARALAEETTADTSPPR